MRSFYQFYSPHILTANMLHHFGCGIRRSHTYLVQFLENKQSCSTGIWTSKPNSELKTMLANVVWPSLYLADRLVAPTVIVISLAIEFAALKHVLKFSVKRTCALVVAINLTSAIVGCYLISTAGYHWELGPGADIADYLNTGTFNSISWVLAIVLAIVTNTALESVVAVALFKVRSGRAIRWLAYGNSATALLAYLSIRVVPPHL